MRYLVSLRPGFMMLAVWNLLDNQNTVDPLFSGHALQLTSLCRGHLSITETILGNQLQVFYCNLPLYSGHLSIADTYFEDQWCTLQRGSTVLNYQCSLFDFSFGQSRSIGPFVLQPLNNRFLQKLLDKQNCSLCILDSHF